MERPGRNTCARAPSHVAGPRQPYTEPPPSSRPTGPTSCSLSPLSDVELDIPLLIISDPTHPLPSILKGCKQNIHPFKCTHTHTSCVTTGQGHKGLSTAGPGLGAGDGPGTLPPASSMTPSVGWGASRLLRMGLAKTNKGQMTGAQGRGQQPSRWKDTAHALCPWVAWEPPPAAQAQQNRAEGRPALPRPKSPFWPLGHHPRKCSGPSPNRVPAFPAAGGEKGQKPQART